MFPFSARPAAQPEGLDSDESLRVTAMLSEARLERRGTRARELIAAANVILLGYDDQEEILVRYDPEQYHGLPGL